MFDFITINWNKLSSPAEFLFLIFALGVAVGAIYYIAKSRSTGLIADNNTATIDSYKNRLEAVESETKECKDQHNDSLKLIHTMQGELKAYKELVLIPKEFLKELQRNQKEIIKILKEDK